MMIVKETEGVGGVGEGNPEVHEVRVVGVHVEPEHGRLEGEGTTDGGGGGGNSAGMV